MIQIGFKSDALSSISDWSILSQFRFDWLRAPSYQYQFENLSEKRVFAKGRITFSSGTRLSETYNMVSM